MYAGPDRDALARTDLADTQALLLTADRQLTESADLAERTAEAQAEQNRFRDAAHAFWLTDRVPQALGQERSRPWNRP